jgi:hypothetical protein
MFGKYALAARIGRGGKAPAGKARVALMAVRPHCRITGVWQRNPISGRIELTWQVALEARRQRDADEAPSRRTRLPTRRALVVARHPGAAVDIIQPDHRAA